MSSVIVNLEGLARAMRELSVTTTDGKDLTDLRENAVRVSWGRGVSGGWMKVEYRGKSREVQEVDARGAGVAVTFAGRLRRIINAHHGDETTTIGVEGDMVALRFKRAEYRLFTFPTADYDAGKASPEPVAPPIKAPAPVRAALAKAHAKPAPVAAPANPAPAPTVHAPSTGRPPAAKAHTLSAPAAALVAGLARIGKPANKAALLAVGVDRATWSEALSEAYRAGAVRRVKGADVLHALA
jgi:hypothetical protein